MRVLLQRATKGSVSVDNQTVGQIDHGYVLLTGIGQDDTPAIVHKMASKIVNLRLFNNDQGKFDRSLLDVGGGALVVSQFTLFGDARKGRRPNFSAAASPDLAAPLCDNFAQALHDLGAAPVQSGIFGADMHVNIHNDGPVTLWLDSDEW